MLREKLGIQNLSMAERGLVASAKAFMFRAARRAGVIPKSAPRKEYKTSDILHPTGNFRMCHLAQPVLTEFSKGPMTAPAPPVTRVKSV